MHDPTQRRPTAGLIPGCVSSAADAPPVHRIIAPEGDAFGTLLALDIRSDDEAPILLAAQCAAAEPPERLIVWPAPIARDDLPWMPALRKRFEDRCDRVAEIAPGSTPTLWPHAACAAGDAPSLATFLRARPAWRFVFDPLSMLTPDMLAEAPDHLARLFELLGGHAQSVAVVMGAGRVVGERVVPVSPEGDDEAAVAELVATHVSRWCPPRLPAFTPA